MKKTFLDIPHAMEEYAEAHGAFFDKTTHKWYVTGEVPIDLEDFLPKQVRQAIPEYGPSCPKCNASMKKRFRKADLDPFWGCSRYPACSGVLNWDSDKAKHALELAAAAPLFNKGNSPHQRFEQNKKNESSPFREQWHEIARLAFEKLGNQRAVDRWLDSKMVTLEGKRPLDIMNTAEGCEQVKKLLDSF